MTSKVESCNGFARWLSFGTDGVLADNDPAQVGTAAGWATVSTSGITVYGDDHTCAVRTNHTLWCWGDNYYGELGTGAASASDDTPAQVGTAARWAAVSVGPQSACATRTDGTLWCWGDNEAGQLGTGQRSFFSSPRQVPGTGWAAVSVGDGGIGDDHTCAVRTGHTLWCWGSNGHGQLGTGGTGGTSTPVQVGTAADWVTVSAGGEGDYSGGHTCATRAGGTLWCWGDDEFGELGNGISGIVPTPRPVH